MEFWEDVSHQTKQDLSMRNSYVFLFLICFYRSYAQEANQIAQTTTFQLSAPIIGASSVFFTDDTEIKLAFDFPNAVIRYTLNGGPVSNQSPVYEGPFSLKESTKVKAKVFHPDYLESDEVEVKVLKTANNQSIKDIEIEPNPNSKFSGLGATGLIDRKKGSMSFSSDAQWLGFQSDSIRLKTIFSKPTPISKIILSSLINQSSWIFSPEKVAVFSDGHLVGSVTFSDVEKQGLSQFEFLEVPVKSGNYEYLEVVVYPLQNIPDWHQGKGTKPWLFIDELLMQ